MTHQITHIMPFPSLGGVEIATLRLMTGLGSEFRHTAFCLNGADGLMGAFAEAGVEAVSYEPVEPSYRHPRAFLRNSWRLAREFRRRDIRLVHCQDILAAYYAAVAGRLAGVPVLCHVRAQRPVISRRDASFLFAVNQFAFVSHDARNCFGAEVGRARGTVIYDGFDFVEVDREQARREVRREFGMPADARIVGMVARVARQKDYETLVRAAARVTAALPEARFLIVGDHDSQPDYRAHYREVQEMVAGAGLTRHFLFTGHRQDVVRMLAAMDVSVLCTHTEGFALSVLEAMGQGIPVVATAVGGLPEFVIDGETGLLHAHRDDAGLADKILSVLGDPSFAARLSGAGRELIATKFNRQRMLANTAALYRRMIEGRRLRPQSASTIAGHRIGDVTQGGN